MTYTYLSKHTYLGKYLLCRDMMLMLVGTYLPTYRYRTLLITYIMWESARFACHHAVFYFSCFHEFGEEWLIIASIIHNLTNILPCVLFKTYLVLLLYWEREIINWLRFGRNGLCRIWDSSICPSNTINPGSLLWRQCNWKILAHKTSDWDPTGSRQWLRQWFRDGTLR